MSNFAHPVAQRAALDPAHSYTNNNVTASARHVALTSKASRSSTPLAAGESNNASKEA